jgi:hypothetical protein
MTGTGARCRRAIAIGCMALVAVSATAETVIEMKAGDRIVLGDDGSMTHYDKDGAPVDMADGVVMTTKDGHRVLMKSRSLWREIVALAARTYAEAQVGRRPPTPSGRTIALADGGLIVVDADGSMTHYDVGHNRVPMPSGAEMTTKDGSKLLMQNGSLWESVSKHEHLK